MLSRSLAVVAERNVSTEVTFGTFGNGASTTVRPFASFFSVIFGRFNGRAAPVVRVVPVGEGVFPKADPLEELVRLIQHVDANLFTHERLLVLEVLFADVERTRAIGFQPQTR